MNSSIITKKIIANAFKSFMKSQPFVKISVSDIMKACQMRRQTFYYHFQDKFELLEWIYQHETKENISDFINYERWENIFNQLFDYFYQNQLFYKNALDVTEQNSFIDYLSQHTRTLYLKTINDILVHSNNTLDTDKKEIIASFYSHGFVGLIKEWIENSCSPEPEYMANTVKTSIHDQLTKAIQQSQVPIGGDQS
ncbi:dihydroxyacetone kinase transcriptional activator DhaS [Paraliobacillus sediminis]|uniref:dihydroxyacetone kinase transcriptional activator DhaS n=1 Tax=Paraliobacillus sediminis TaxID=1885916 RepID=UPI000E3D30F2|nr:dihydroxyacetone kinase transcriptional activator DhaS [Paraliobacillus sediminis]